MQILKQPIPPVVLILVLVSPSWLRGDSRDATGAAVKAAIDKAIPLLEQAAAGSSAHRQCFTCHGHALPVLAIVEARKRGFTINEDNLQAQLQHTAADLVRGKANYLQGRGQGGRHIRAGYALWTLQAGGWPADKTTSAVTGYLVWDEDVEHWRSPSNRPPSEVSHFTATYVALRGLGEYGTEQQAERIAKRRKKSRDWLIRTLPKETEDHVFRLLALSHLDVESSRLQAAANRLIETQRDDGGWAQLPEGTSDAYATGSVLYALYETAALSPDDEVYQRGVEYLLRSQLADGSWLVRSRSKPFQTYYESGFPHGGDQFISMAASSWATLALMFSYTASTTGQADAPFPEHKFITSDPSVEDLWPCFSPDGKKVLFSRKAAGDRTWYLHSVDLTAGTPSPFPPRTSRIAGTRANWSWNRNLIAFNGRPSRGNFNLSLIDGNSSEVRLLAFTGLNDQMSYPSWYPDANRFAVVDFSLQQASVVRRIDLKNKTVVTLTDPKTHWAGVPRVSPDGKLIVMGGQTKQGQRYTQYQNTIWFLDSNGMRPLDSQRGWAPFWSPDGEWFVFASDRNSQEGRWAIFVAKRDGSRIQQLTPHHRHASHPTWSPDGKRIAFSARMSPESVARGIAVLEIARWNPVKF